jgi:nickel superoxide dismutase
MRVALAKVALFLLVLWGGVREARAHCQVPCGIYDDPARLTQMLEDVTTIEKAVAQVRELAGKPDALSFNQASRWVATKETHAQRIMTTVAEYFLAQKIAPADPQNAEAWKDYLQRLADHHQVMVLAMKAKQTVDPDLVAKLRAAVQRLEPYWAPKK